MTDPVDATDTDAQLAEPQPQHAERRVAHAGVRGDRLAKALIGGLFTMFVFVGGILVINFNSINDRFVSIENRLDNIDSEMNTRETNLRAEINNLETNLRAEIADLREEIYGALSEISRNILELSKSVARIEGHLGINDKNEETATQAADPATLSKPLPSNHLADDFYDVSGT